MTYKSLVAGAELENPREEAKKAIRLEQYRVSEAAVFSPTEPICRYRP